MAKTELADVILDRMEALLGATLEELLRRYLEQRRDMGETRARARRSHGGRSDEAHRREGGRRRARGQPPAIGAKHSPRPAPHHRRARRDRAGSPSRFPHARGVRVARSLRLSSGAGLVVGGVDRERLRRRHRQRSYARRRSIRSCAHAPRAISTRPRRTPCRATVRPRARLMCIGEGPGANEDETGMPFVGQAGQLLTKILAAIDLKREEVYICQRGQAPSAGQSRAAAGGGESVSSIFGAPGRDYPPRCDSRAGDVRGASPARNDGSPRQAAGTGASLSRYSRDRHLSPRSASQESRLEAPHVGRCPARPSNSRCAPAGA